ncbi:MAG TPA: hypothetical protein VHU18_09535 [Rhizomicrobium sp.]|jgi:hypothetical protein|nr:hypothetical protein [Rhizomicrobium sp.]
MSTRRDLFKSSVLSAFAMMSAPSLLRAQPKLDDPILVYATDVTDPNNELDVVLFLVRPNANSKYEARKASFFQPRPTATKLWKGRKLKIVTGQKTYYLETDKTDGTVLDKDLDHLAVPMKWIETGAEKLTSHSGKPCREIMPLKG